MKKKPKYSIGAISGIIGLVLGILALGKVLFAWGANQNELEKDIKYLYQTDEKVVADTEEAKDNFNDFLLKQSVFNQSVTGILENMNKKK